MKLWLLTADESTGLWQPWYDKAFGFVVRAESEEDARNYAADKAGDEGREAWLEPESSTCVEITGEGAAEVILQDLGIIYLNPLTNARDSSTIRFMEFPIPANSGE